MVLKSKANPHPKTTNNPNWWTAENITALLLEATDGGTIKMILERAEVKTHPATFSKFLRMHGQCPPGECPKGRFVQEFYKVMGPANSMTDIEAEDILNRALDAVRHHCECGGRKDDPDMIACYDCLELDKNGEPPFDRKDRNIHDNLMRTVVAGRHTLYPKLVA